MNKPIDLIVANTMHDVVSQVGQAIDLLKALGHKDGSVKVDAAGREAIARKLLCNIAHDASLSKVFLALQAIGAPHSHDDIGEGVKVVMEANE